MAARPSTRPSKKKDEEKEKAISVDEAFLKQYYQNAQQYAHVEDVETGEEVSADEALAQTTEEVVDTAESDKKLNAALKRGEAKARREKQRLAKLQQRAEVMDAAADERVARVKEQEDQQSAKEAERQKKETAHGVERGVHAVNQVLNTQVQPMIDKVGSAPAPGGIGFLLLILGILLAVVVQVNAAGDTRLKQFWYMLNGRAKLQGRVDVTKGSQVGAGSTFGTGTTTIPTIPPPPGNLTVPPATGTTTPTTGVQPFPGPTIPPPGGSTIGSLAGTIPGQNGTFRSTPSNLGF